MELHLALLNPVWDTNPAYFYNVYAEERKNLDDDTKIQDSILTSGM